MDKKFFPIILKKRSYLDRIKKIFGSSIVGYYPMSEPNGLVCGDESGNNRDGSYSGVLLGQPGIGDGKTCPYFDGVNDYAAPLNGVNGVASHMNKEEGSLIIWGKAENPGGAGPGYMLVMTDLGGGYLWMRHSGVNTVTIGSRVHSLDNAWHCYALTWTVSGGNIMRSYMDGAQVGADDTVPVLVLIQDYLAIGYYDTINNLGPYQGWLAHAIYLNRPASLLEVIQVSIK